MRLAQKITSLKNEITFRDQAEKRLFWRESVQNIRYTSLCLETFGIVSWALSRLIAHPGITFNTTYTIIGLCGKILGSIATYLSREILTAAISSVIYTLAIAFSFYIDIASAQSPEFWVIPIGIMITVGMAPIFSDPYSYSLDFIIVWIIISYGNVGSLMKSPDSNWVIQIVVAALFMGLLINILFVQERKKIFLVQRELVKLAFKDTLTGIDNRRSLMEALHDVHTRAANGDFYFLMIDIDNFKQVNDTSGHEVGDQVLVGVATIIDQYAHRHSRGRLGGEEFGVVFSGEESAVCDFARQLCQAVAQLQVSAHTVTVSIGISKLRETMSLTEIYRLADQGLYEAKHHGKNRYVLAS